MASKQTTMPPPGGKKPAAVVAIGIPKGGAGDSQTGGDPGASGKASPAEAHVVKADQHCKDCENWDPSSGDCSAVDGNYDAEDACIKYFQAGGDEPDADDAASAPDTGAGDSSMPPGMPT